MTTTFLRRLDFTVTTRHEKVKPKNTEIKYNQLTNNKITVIITDVT